MSPDFARAQNIERLQVLRAEPLLKSELDGFRLVGGIGSAQESLDARDIGSGWLLAIDVLLGLYCSFEVLRMQEYRRGNQNGIDVGLR